MTDAPAPPDAADAAVSEVALLWKAESFSVDQAKLMGRHAAGNGFLRAALAAWGDGAVAAYGTDAARPAFEATLAAMAPGAQGRWIRAHNLDALRAVGGCHRQDPILSAEARLRLRAGPAAYSLTGVTHTISAQWILQELAGHLREPLMPWDAVICTSGAVAETIRGLWGAEADYLRWRLGASAVPEGPQLPVIPLGVHGEDFAVGPDVRGPARSLLSLGEDDICALFVGRLAFSVKAHPGPMFQGLQAAAARTGRSVSLVLCGWWANSGMEQAFRAAAAAMAPDVRLVVVDGRDPTVRAESLAAADLFVSLSDNIQETFGLTPVEAMAAGLPVVVSDWDGYRDTVRDGVDGFRVRTWAPPAGTLEPVARQAEAGTMGYDEYCWGAAAATSVDLDELTGRLVALIENPDLRARMGASGRARARDVFDWAVVFPQYRALWRELGERRRAASESGAPRVASQAREPFDTFAHYPSRLIEAGVTAGLRPGVGWEDFEVLQKLSVFMQSYSDPGHAGAVWRVLAAGDARVADVARAAGLPLAVVQRTLATLAKMGLVRFG